MELPHLRTAAVLGCLVLVPACGGDDPVDEPSPREQVFETVGRYLGAINFGNARATCAEFAMSLRESLEERGGAPCAKLYAAAGVNRRNEAPGALKGTVPGMSPAAVHIEGHRAELHGIKLQRISGRWRIVGGLPDKVAGRL
jgi:hypothetical protein